MFTLPFMSPSARIFMPASVDLSLTAPLCMRLTISVTASCCGLSTGDFILSGSVGSNNRDVAYLCSLVRIVHCGKVVSNQCSICEGLGGSIASGFDFSLALDLHLVAEVRKDADTPDVVEFPTFALHQHNFQIYTLTPTMLRVY